MEEGGGVIMQEARQLLALEVPALAAFPLRLTPIQRAEPRHVCPCPPPYCLPPLAPQPH